MEKQEMKVEWKLETEMEMRQSFARDTAYRVEMVLCAVMEEGTESNPINLEDWRAVGLMLLYKATCSLKR